MSLHEVRFIRDILLETVHAKPKLMSDHGKNILTVMYRGIGISDVKGSVPVLF